jgi:YD repeat-containing protein
MATATGYDGDVTTYVYDNASLLRTATQAAKGQVISYRYDGAGQILTITDTGTAVGSYAAYTRKTDYAYDLAGNRIRDTMLLGSKTFQDDTVVYDALGNVLSISSQDAVEGAQTITYQYDGFGNRIRLTTVAAGKGSDRNQDGYFQYDALDRMLQSGSTSAAGATSTSTLIHEYDASGNVKASIVGTRIERYTYDAMNRLYQTTVNGVLVATTSYDRAGRIIGESTKLDDQPGLPAGMPKPTEPVQPTAPVDPGAGATQAQIDLYNQQKAKYDQDMVTYNAAMLKYAEDLQDYTDQRAYFKQLSESTVAVTGYERHIRRYDAEGRLVVDQGLKDDGTIKSLMINETFDVASNVLVYRSESFVADHMRTDYTNVYRTLGVGVQLDTSGGKQTALTGKLAGKSGALSHSKMVYDPNGQLTGVLYTTDGNVPSTGASNKVFIRDQHGNIVLSRTQSYQSPTSEQHQIMANGELHLRYSTHTGVFVGLADEQEDAFWKAYNKDAFQSLLTPGGQGEVEGGANGSTGQTIAALEGDTLSTIALRVYGSADAWYRLADANNMQFDEPLSVGQPVLAPAVAEYDYQLDYNNSKLVGDTSPNVPPPPAGNKDCITMVIMIVVIIVACIVAPYMLYFAEAMFGAGAAATVAAGAMTGAVANMAGQTVAIAADEQDGYNWKQVGSAAIAGGLAAGLTQYAPEMTGVERAVTTNVVMQAVNVKLGLQDKFSWAAVAGAAVGAQVGENLESGKYGDFFKASQDDNAFSHLVRGTLKGYASGLTTELLTPGHNDYVKVGKNALRDGVSAAVDYQANQAGNWIADQMRMAGMYPIAKATGRPAPMTSLISDTDLRQIPAADADARDWKWLQASQSPASSSEELERLDRPDVNVVNERGSISVSTNDEEEARRQVAFDRQEYLIASVGGGGSAPKGFNNSRLSRAETDVLFASVPSFLGTNVSNSGTTFDGIIRENLRLNGSLNGSVDDQNQTVNGYALGLLVVAATYNVNPSMRPVIEAGISPFDFAYKTEFFGAKEFVRGLSKDLGRFDEGGYSQLGYFQQRGRSDNLTPMFDDNYAGNPTYHAVYDAVFGVNETTSERIRAALPALVGALIGFTAVKSAQRITAPRAVTPKVRPLADNMLAESEIDSSKLAINTNSAPHSSEIRQGGNGPVMGLQSGDPLNPSFVGPPRPPIRGSTIGANNLAGEEWSTEVLDNLLPLTQTNIQREITVRSLGPSGKRTRLDAVGTDKNSSSIVLSEMKASATAPLTPNQRIVHPELSVYGGVVVGAGKAPYVGGTKIPPTPVVIIRKP